MRSRSKPIITLEQLRKTACAKLKENQHLFAKPQKRKKAVAVIGGKIVAALYSTGSEEKDRILIVLFDFCLKRGLRLHMEYRFVNDRRWRFDWCIPELLLAVEYEGIYSAKSRHTNVNGYSKDTTKYNRAAQEGWIVLRYTAQTYHLIDSQLNAFIKHNA